MTDRLVQRASFANQQPGFNGLAAFSRSEHHLFKEFIDAFSAEVAIVDGNGRIVLANNGWMSRSNPLGPSSSGALIGKKPLHFVDERTNQKIADTIGAVIGGKLPVGRLDFRSLRGKTLRDYRLYAMPFEHGDFKGAIIVNEDVSALHDLLREKRLLITQLMESEERERGRIAREMHDSTAQDLVAIGLNLTRLAHLADDPLVRDVLQDVRTILTRTQQDIRTMSYLLHPPLLEEGGLEFALSSLVRGLSSRTDVSIKFECNGSPARFAIGIEMALYRIAQEALINVHKHSSAKSAVVRYRREASDLVLEVQDDGRGFDPGNDQNILFGVGIKGMRARLKLLGGELTLSNVHPGTYLRAVVPIPECVEA